MREAREQPLHAAVLVAAAAVEGAVVVEAKRVVEPGEGRVPPLLLQRLEREPVARELQQVPPDEQPVARREGAVPG